MYSLNPGEIEIVSNAIQKAGISYSHLYDDLIDHICCDVEEEMISGISFNEAFERVCQKFGIEELKNIQENTIMLIDKKYGIMKTSVKIFGNLALALIGAGTVFKIFHWPGAGVLLILGFFILCCVFLPSLVYSIYKEQKDRRNIYLHISGFLSGLALISGILFKVMHWPGAPILMIGGTIGVCFLFLPVFLFWKLSGKKSKNLKWAYTIGFLGAFLYTLGFLFKIQHWPGTGVLLLGGVALSIWVFLPLYTYQKFKNTKAVSERYIFLVFGAMLFVLFGLLINLSVSGSFLDSFVITENNALTNKDQIAQKNNIYYDIYLHDSLYKDVNQKLSDLRAKTNELDKHIRTLKKDLIYFCDQDEGVFKSENEAESRDILHKDGTKTVHIFMLDGMGDSKATVLKNKIKAYKTSVLSMIDGEAALFNELLQIDLDEGKQGETLSWEVYNFEYAPLIGVIDNLTIIQQGIRIVESEAIELIVSQILENQKS